MGLGFGFSVYGRTSPVQKMLDDVEVTGLGHPALAILRAYLGFGEAQLPIP